MHPKERQNAYEQVGKVVTPQMTNANSITFTCVSNSFSNAFWGVSVKVCKKIIMNIAWNKTSDDGIPTLCVNT